MTETWKPIPDFPGYDVSDHGRVRSYHAQVKGRSDSNGAGWIIAESPQRMLSPSPTSKRGYLHVNLSNGDGRNHPRYIHRLVTLAFLGPCPDGLQVCHNDDDPDNNHLPNLRYDTPQANIADMMQRRGFAGKAPIPDDQIQDMREARNTGTSCRQLAEQYGLSLTHISRIVYGQAYPNSPGPTTHPPARWKPHKLTDTQVCEIRQRLASNGTTGAALAREYGVSEAMISRIKNGSRRQEAS